MRLRFAVLASLLTAFVAVVPPSAVSAAPKHNHHLTINAVPRHITAGDGVWIYGRLEGGNVVGRTIRLYHHIAEQPGYSLVATTTTGPGGYYLFTRQEGVVLTNRSWFVRGPDGSHSRTVHESVSARVSLSANSTAAVTSEPVVFTGHIYPPHPYEPVLLQEHNRSGDDWHTIKRGFTDGGSNFRIVYRWRVPGAYEVRAVLPGDLRNVRSYSDSVTVTVQQKQVKGFTIQSSSPVIDYGQSATISGVLDKAGSSTPDGGTDVTLLGRTAGSHTYQVLGAAKTGSDGTYSFAPQSPQHNTEYVVRVTHSPHRHSAYLFEGVRDTVSLAEAPSPAPTGSTAMFTGTVLPGKPGGVVYLQRLGSDGDWYTVEVGSLNSLSAYTLKWTLGRPGSETFRTRVLGDSTNLGGVSKPVTVTVVAPPSAATLPAAS